MHESRVRSFSRPTVAPERVLSADRFRERFLVIWHTITALNRPSGVSDSTKELGSPAKNIVSEAGFNAHETTGKSAQPVDDQAGDELYRLTPRLSERERRLVLQTDQSTCDSAGKGNNRLSTVSDFPCPSEYLEDIPLNATVPKTKIAKRGMSPISANLESFGSESTQRRGSYLTRGSVSEASKQGLGGESGNPAFSKSNQMHFGNDQPVTAGCDTPIKHEEPTTVELGEEEDISHDRPDGAPSRHDAVLRRPKRVVKGGCSSPILIHLPRMANDPRCLFFVLNMDNDNLSARPTTTKHMLDIACKQAFADKSMLECTKHDERLFSVVFKSAKQARQVEGTQIMLNGSLIGAEVGPQNRPCSFFWTRAPADLGEEEIVSGVISAFPDSQWRPLLYKQSNDTILEYVLFFQPCPGLLRLCLPIQRGEGETMWAWFRPRLPRSQCRMCYETHPARCYRRATRLL